jgi:hypothetical protein
MRGCVTVIEFSILVTCIGNTAGVIGGIAVSLRNSKKITEVHDSTNSKVDALIKEVRESSFAKGVKSERDKAL